MRIQELNLVAFGPFTDKCLAFDEAGFHIIYGPNEAGKSSALRGLKSLLYGIEERTHDNFLHANDKLRIQGCLRTSGGQELSFVRRKGRKNTLLTPADEVLDKQALTPFLQGVTAELFETLFGIDHPALVQGGQEILEQKGEVGQALFSAALGSHALHAVLAQFDAEADALFRPRGTTQEINAKLRSYAELNKSVREYSLSSNKWDEHRRALGRTSKELAQIQDELADRRIEVNRLQRIQRVLPKLARRRELLQELGPLTGVVILADDFFTRRQETLHALETARAIIGKVTPRFDDQQQQLEGLSINPAVLEQAENIEDLHARLGGHRKALQDRPHRVAEAQQLMADAEAILKEIRPDLELKDIDALRSVLTRRQAIAEVGGNQPVLISRQEQVDASRRETETRLKAARKERDAIPEPGSSDALRRAIASARKQGDVDTSIQTAHGELIELRRTCAAELSRLALWKGALEDLPGLALPNQESIHRLEDAYSELGKELQRLEEKRQQAADNLRDSLQRLDEIQRVGVVPTESDLAEARSGRDRLWRLLRRHWVDDEDISLEATSYEKEGALPDVFEKRLTGTDELSDRLRREAERVHALAGLQAQQEALRLQIEEVCGQIRGRATEKAQMDTDWQTLWKDVQIEPLSPREMRFWLEGMEKLRDRVGQLHLLRQKAEEQEQHRQKHVHRLNEELGELGKNGSTSEELEGLLLKCEEIAQQLEETKRRRDALVKEVKEQEADLVTLTEDYQLATDALAEWNSRWTGLMQGLGLPIDASPVEVEDFIEKVRLLFSKQAEAEKLQIRIQAIDEDAASFREQVTTMATAIAPELAGLSVDDAVMRLNALLVENRVNQTKRLQIESQIEQARQEIQDSQAVIQTMTERLDALCREAKCANSAELELAERQSIDHLRIKAALAKIEQEILETGEGASVVELEAESDGMSSDALPGRIQELSHKIEDDLEPRRTDLAQTKGREEKELELMDGGDQAAVLADQAQATLAGIRTDAERYVRVRLASKILRDQIEQYRKENQGPLVQRASEHFVTLTQGSFEGLMTDFNERDEPILAGLRADGKRVHVEGMSSGTRDQLYLALRLASLEKYMESAESMPFIIDDVLVDFDDDRSGAALNALSELADKTQIILFTHHSKIVEQAKQLDRAVHVLVL